MVGFGVSLPATPTTPPLPRPDHGGRHHDHGCGHVGDLDRSAPGTRIDPAGYGEVTVSGGPVPAVDSLQFPATQTYDNGTVIRWDEPTPASGQEPLHPVPTLTITGGGAAAVPAPPVSTPGGTAPNDGPDTTAAVVAVIGVVVVAAAVSGVLALRGRRARPSAPRR
jgi:hypothetical protein